MISLYIPGDSPVHRASAGLKLLLVALIAGVLSLMPAGPVAISLGVLLPILCYLLAGLGVKRLWGDVAQLWGVLLVVGLTQLFFIGPLIAVNNTVRVVCIVLLAQCLTRTTAVGGMIETAETMLGPLRRFGVNPQRVGLAMALALTSIGQIADVVRQVRDAQRCRGVRLSPWAWVMPVLVLTLRHADEVGDALEARGAVE